MHHPLTFLNITVLLSNVLLIQRRFFLNKLPFKNAHLLLKKRRHRVAYFNVLFKKEELP